MILFVEKAQGLAGLHLQLPADPAVAVVGDVSDEATAARAISPRRSMKT